VAVAAVVTATMVVLVVLAVVVVFQVVLLRLVVQHHQLVKVTRVGEMLDLSLLRILLVVVAVQVELGQTPLAVPLREMVVQVLRR
jgi:hypothetical protein